MQKARRYGLFLLLCAMAIACRQNPRKQPVATKNTVAKSVAPRRFHSIKELYRDTGAVNLTDEGSFWLLNFRPGKVYFEFNPSCDYWFPTVLKGDTIIFSWAENMDCIFDRGLRKTFPHARSPRFGKPFGEIYLLSDSVVGVSYYYKEWVQKVNESEKATIDTLFPTRFKVVEL